MQSGKILCILQARMSSTRLPGKILKEIKDKPLIAYEIDRIKKSKKIDKIVIATSYDATNDILEDFCKKYNIDCFRGEENDVLKRFFDCSNKYDDYDIIVRLTWDCPLIDPDILDETIKKFLKADVEYWSNSEPPTFPDWLDAEIFTRTALEITNEKSVLLSEREHVTPYMKKHFKKINYAFDIDFSWYRLTVDEKEDLELIEKLIINIWSDSWFLDYIKYIQDNWLEEINNKFERNEWFKKSLEQDKKYHPAL